LNLFKHRDAVEGDAAGVVLDNEVHWRKCGILEAEAEEISDAFKSLYAPDAEDSGPNGRGAFWFLVWLGLPF
jgi:hypothetical protein